VKRISINFFCAMIACSAVWALVLASGCDRKPTQSGPLAKPVFGDSTVGGTVRFSGEPPRRKMFEDSARCHAGAKPVQDELVVVDQSSRGLRDVVVVLEGAQASDGYDQPQLLLDQVGCQYVPHVLAVQVNQQVKITTSDPVFHNVHWVSRLNGDVNFALPQAGDLKLHRFVAAEVLRLRCDVHPWMEAHVHVVDSPFFSVSGPTGEFRIGRVPAGNYTLVARHRLLGEIRREVVVGAGASIDVDFDFSTSR
jgi:plastocyanin